MSRILLIHWHSAEAEARAQKLRRAGHEVDCHTTQDGAALRGVAENPPDAVLIDLTRLPSQGLAVATWLRQRKATRHTPLLFVDGAPEKRGRTRRMLPDAVYTDWPRVRSAVRQAIRRVPEAPVVPGTFAPYAGTPLPKKLGIRPEAIVALAGAPPGFERTLGRLPEGVQLHRRLRGPAQVVLLFVTSENELKRRSPAAARALADKGALWVVLPKKSSGVESDLSQTGVRAFGLGSGFVDYKVCAIDETWTGLCFARRGR